MVLLDGLERLISSFQAEEGRLALCVRGRDSSTLHLGKSSSTSYPVQGNTLSRHLCHSQKRALPGAADTKPQGREDTVTALSATACIFAGLGHLLSSFLSWRIMKAENKFLTSLRL